MREYILKILDIVPTNWFKSSFIIFILTLFNAFFEILGIGMVIPFLSVFVNENNLVLSQVNFLNNYTKENLILIFLVIFILIFALKNFISVLIQKKKVHFSHDVATELSSKLYLKYLKKKYIYFTLRNTSELIRNIVDETNLFSFGVVIGVLNLIIDLIIFITITIFLFLYNPIASTIAFVVMTILGYITIYFQHNKLKSFGLKRQIHSYAIIKLINESIGNIKEIILSGTHNFFENKFRYHVMENAKSGKGKDYYFILPRPILEVVAIFMIFMLVYALTRIQQSSSDILITIGVFSFASIKLIPSVTNIMKGIQGLKYHKVVVDLMYNEFKNQEDELNLPKNNLKENKIFNFKKIKFKNVNYNYPNNNNYILKNINLEILKGEKIGIVGESGSGKTTLINLITGLLSPTLGKIELNEDMLINNLGNLQKKIGYVSQSVYLADESLKFNVAFKKIGENINEDRINNLISLLKLNDLIISKKDGLSTTVGEKGIKLSAGQIQRIGIARALYDTPDILILDEATNALDLSTQEKVLKNIYNEMENKTVISISHDVNSLKYCAKIYLLKDCELKNYDKK